LEITVIIPVKERLIPLVVELTLDDKDLKCWKNVLDAVSKQANRTVTQLFYTTSESIIALTKVEQLKENGVYVVASDEPLRMKPKYKLSED
jgi:hypothetical protein